MCLKIWESATENFKKIHKDRKFVKVYKELFVHELSDSQHISLNYLTPIKDIPVYGGWLIASPENVKFDKFIHAGAIHCWETPKSGYRTCHNYYQTCIECWAQMSDFIAFGTQCDLAFKKIYVPRKNLYANVAVGNRDI